MLTLTATVGAIVPFPIGSGKHNYTIETITPTHVEAYRTDAYSTGTQTRFRAKWTRADFERRTGWMLPKNEQTNNS
jgi:hypothetical protein